MGWRAMDASAPGKSAIDILREYVKISMFDVIEHRSSELTDRETKGGARVLQTLRSAWQFLR